MKRDAGWQKKKTGCVDDNKENNRGNKLKKRFKR